MPLATEEFKERLLKEYDGEYDVLIAFAEIFAARSGELIEQARDAFESRDGESFTRHIHSLKGSLSQLYLDEMVAAAALIERASRSEGLSSHLFEKLAALEEKLMTLNHWLHENLLKNQD